MTHQFVFCSNNHKLKATPKLFGQTHPCPSCGERVTIPIEPPPQHPLLDIAPQKKTVSDSSILRVLGSCDSLPAPPRLREEPKRRPCPRCDLSISVTANVCEHCHCYVGKVPNFMQKMMRKKR